MKPILAIVSCALLVACSPKQLIVHDPVEVKVPVPVPCTTQLPPEPESKVQDVELLNKSVYVKGKAVIEDLEVTRAHAKELKALLRPCVQPAK
jgi:hypothetical protein